MLREKQRMGVAQNRPTSMPLAQNWRYRWQRPDHWATGWHPAAVARPCTLAILRRFWINITRVHWGK
jgi:hypothetical protein